MSRWQSDEITYTIKRKQGCNADGIEKNNCQWGKKEYNKGECESYFDEKKVHMMFRLQRQKEQKRTEQQKHLFPENGGFSLVELIIVIAIMSVLTGVLTPMYLRYAEKSRETVRLQRADNFRRCFEVAVLEVVAAGDADREGQERFTVTSNGRLDQETAYNKALKKALDESFGSDYTGLCVNVMYGVSDGIPFQYYLIFEESGGNYEYCQTTDDTALDFLQEGGYTKLSGTDWYYIKSDAPDAM